MKIIKYLIIISILFFTLPAFKNIKLNLKWASPASFKIPESVIYDKENNALYVSNINGKSDEKNNQGFLSRINPESKKINLLVKHKGGIDGLKHYKRNSFIVTDWAGKTQIITKNKKPQILLDTTEKRINATDFEYIPAQKLIIIPTFFHNRIFFYTLD